MDIRKIEVFAKVFEHSSFSKAGKSLYLSQPTISAHVASLEQELGISLFDRIGRTVVPTKAGEILYQHARRIFEASELARSEIQKLQERITGKLDVGGSTIPANYLLPEMLTHFWHAYPEVTIDLRVGDSEEIISMVHDNDLMLGIVGAALTSPELAYEPLMDDQLALVMHPDLYQKFSHLSGQELLVSLPWVFREEGSGTRLAMVRALTDLGIDMQHLRHVIMVRNAGAMAKCILSGIGAGITSKHTVADALNQNQLVAVDMPGLLIERTFYVVYNKRRSLFPAALKLIDFLKSEAAIAIKNGVYV